MGDVAEITITQPETGPVAPVVLSDTPRPDNVPEEFWDAEKGVMKTDEMLAALAAQGTEEAPKAGEETTENTPLEGEGEEEALAAEAGIDIAAVEASFLESGTIPEDTYEKAAKIGVSKEMVDEFVQYRVKQADMLREEMFQPFGGNDAVDAMIAWAGTNWTEAQANAFNEATGSADRGRIELALKALKTDFDRANGVKPKLVTPSGGRVKGGGSFSSMAELMAAQKDPRYAVDPAYRAEVAAKLKRSSI